MNADTCQIAEKNFECDHCSPSRWFISNPSLLRHIKVYHIHEIQKFKYGFPGCNQLIGSKAALKKHKKWHWDINEKKRKRDEQLAKEKQRLEEEEKEKERQNLRKKSKRKVTATASSPAKLLVPSTSVTVIGSSIESTESTFLSFV